MNAKILRSHRPAGLLYLLGLLLALSIAREANATTHIIEARNVFYSPATLTIGLGDTVRFVWIEGTHPTASLTGAWAQFPLDAANPSYELVLGATGVYPYECVIHNIFGMVGTITVEASTPVCDPAVAPSGLAVSPSGPTGAALSWTAIPGADGYHLRGQILGGGGFTNLISTGNSRTIGGLAAATGYRWQLRARCAATDEITPFSELDTFYTPALRAGNASAAIGDAASILIPKSLRYLGAGSTLRFEVQVGRNTPVTTQLLDISGRLLHESSGQLDAGVQVIELPAADFPDGVYLFNLRAGEESAVLRFFRASR